MFSGAAAENEKLPFWHGSYLLMTITVQYLLFQKSATYLKIINDGNIDDNNGYVTGSLGVCGNTATLSLRHGEPGGVYTH